MSEFKFSCPHCDQHIKCDEKLSGKQVQCPVCNHLTSIPLSPAKIASGHNTVQSGQTWDTFLPANRVGLPDGKGLNFATASIR